MTSPTPAQSDAAATPLIERLRKQADGIEQWGVAYVSCPPPLLREAATELAASGETIATLREELAKARAVLHSLPETFRRASWKTPEIRESAATLVRIYIEECIKEKSNAAPD